MKSNLFLAAALMAAAPLNMPARRGARRDPSWGGHCYATDLEGEVRKLKASREVKAWNEAVEARKQAKKQARSKS